MNPPPFRRIWEDNVFRLLLDAGRIDANVVSQIRSWRHTGFSVDRSVRIPADDRDGLERLAQYMARSPFSLTRLLRITRTGQVVYHAEKHRPHRFPDPARDDLFGGVARNFQVFEPLDFLAELTQHIPNQGEHVVRYYGHYSNKARGLRAKQGDQDNAPQAAVENTRTDSEARKRWAMLIQRVYQADPLRCPKCGGTMKVIGFIEAHQSQLVRQILEHCGLWKDPPPPTANVPPRPPPRPRRRSRVSGISEGRRPPCPMPAPDAGVSYEVDPDHLEHARREALDEQDQPHLPWDV